MPATAGLSLAGAMVLFGSAFPSSKVVVEELPHPVAAALRFCLGAVVLLLLLLVRRLRGRSAYERPPRPRAHGAAVVRAAGAGLLGVFAFNALFFKALSLAPAADGSILVPVLSPVLTTAAFVLTGKEVPGRARAAGLIAGAVGAILFFVGIDTSEGDARLLGDLLFVAGAGCWAGYTILSKRLLAGFDALLTTASATAAGAVALVLAALPAAADIDWTTVSAVAWGNIAFLGIGPTAFGYLLYSMALRTVAATTATLAMLAVPMVGVAGSFAVLGETFTPLQVVGASVLLSGAALAVASSPGERGRSSTGPSAAAASPDAADGAR